MKLQVFINHGRTMANCPRCGNAHVVEDATLICSACWKGLRAVKFESDKFGALVQVPHVELIFETRDQAKAAEEEYELEYPPAGIMKVLRVRHYENMNWSPNETVEDLIAENQAHGLES